MCSKVAAGSTFPQRIVQLADAATFSYKQDGHWLAHAEAVAFSPSCLCMFFITTAGNTETRPACRYTRYSLPVLCLYNTFIVTRRRGLNSSLGWEKKLQKIYCVQKRRQIQEGSRKVHDAWRTSEAILTSCLVILRKNQRVLLRVFTKYIYVKFSYLFSFCSVFLFFAGLNVYFLTVGTHNYTNDATTL